MITPIRNTIAKAMMLRFLPNFSVMKLATKQERKQPRTWSETVKDWTLFRSALLKPNEAWKDLKERMPPATPES